MWRGRFGPVGYGKARTGALRCGTAGTEAIRPGPCKRDPGRIAVSERVAYRSYFVIYRSPHYAPHPMYAGRFIPR